MKTRSTIAAVIPSATIFLFALVFASPQAQAQGGIPLWTNRSSSSSPRAAAVDSGEAAPRNPARLGAADHTQPIAWNDLGAKATMQYSGDGLVVKATDKGARLRCVFQKLEGDVTPEGLRLSSTAPGSSNVSFRVSATSVGRVTPCAPFENLAANRSGGAQGTARPTTELPKAGTVEVADKLVRFIRQGLIEEYSVSVDGVRQDFVLPERLPGGGALRVELALSGATAEASSDGARLVLEGSGRKLNYHRLRATDATDKELTARMEVKSEIRNSKSETSLVVVVNDADAVYPVRIDPTFSDANWLASERPGVNGSVTAAVVDGSGNLYIGGQFTWAGGVAATNIAKWDGSRWSALGTGTTAPAVPIEVFALAVLGNDLYAGGFFTTAGGVAARNIAKWNGSAWTALGSGLDGGTVYQGVRALAVSGGNLYAGGFFTNAGGVAAKYIAKWNGSSWSALGAGMNASVDALAVAGSDLYAGGAFTTAGGVAASRIAKWNGSSWSALGTGINDHVIALAVSGSDLYAGGYFTRAGGVTATNVAKWNGSSWSALGSGIGDIVTSLAVSGGDLYAGGYFTNAGGVAARYIAKWNGSSWSALNSGMNSGVRALAVSGGNLYAAGNFTKAGGLVADHVAKWNGSGWSTVGAGTNNFGMDGTVNELAVAGSNLYAGVNLGSGQVVKWDGSNWSELPGWTATDSHYGSYVSALAASGGDLYAAGDYLEIVFEDEYNYYYYHVGCVSKWNGSSWVALGSGIDGSVQALAASGSDLYAGGGFTTAEGVVINQVAKWNGSSWSVLSSGIDGYVHVLAVLGSDLYAGGQFTTVGGVAANHIAKWNGSSWSALGSGMIGGQFSPRVYALAVSGDDLYAGGHFTNAGGVAANHIAKWNGSSWSALGTGMIGGQFSPRVYALAVSGDDLYAGGHFTNAGGVAANNIAKWNGSSWSALGSGLNGVSPGVYAVAVAASGAELYAGGEFTSAGGKFSPHAARASLLSIPPLPSLTIRLTASNTVAISWPSSSTGFVPQQNTNGLSSANWSNVTGTIQNNGTNRFIIVNPPAGGRFYRLAKP